MSRRPRSLADLGEAALIERIARLAGRSPGRGWSLGIGDDAALLRTRMDEELVFSTDAQVENVHFRFGRESSRAIGRRALLVNLSDLAAMGAEPVGALLSLSAPKEALVSNFEGVIRGFVEEGVRYACPLVGGNLSRATEWSLDVTVIGRCRRGRALRRRGMKAGDGLYVTGALGAAALARFKADAAGATLRRLPTPRIAAGRALARLSGARACIDLSDGLSTDLPNLLAADGLGADVEADSLPRGSGFDGACRALGREPLQVMSSGGEDYELLFAFRSRQRAEDASWLARRLGVSVRRIGTVSAECGVRGLPFVEAPHHY
jgi:thiamine-monophosphate kinase